MWKEWDRASWEKSNSRELIHTWYALFLKNVSDMFAPEAGAGFEGQQYPQHSCTLWVHLAWLWGHSRILKSLGTLCKKSSISWQWNGKESLLRGRFGFQIFTAYSVLEKGSNQLWFFWYLPYLLRFAMQSGVRALLSLEASILLLSTPAHSGHDVFWSWLVELFWQPLNWRWAVSKVLVPHPVTKVHCI